MSKVTMMPSRARTDGNQRGLVAAPCHPQAQAGPLISTSEAGKAARKPWVDGPWPLIETPSNTQSVTHPSLHIANEIAHIHNAMLRGLNAVYLQAPHVRQPADIADLMFLALAWSAWVLDHHTLKQTAMLPAFESVLGLQPGSLGSGSVSSSFYKAPEDEGREEGGDDDELATALQHVHAYAATAHADPATYDPVALRALLARLGDLLAPHLSRQVGVLAGTRELCSSSSSSSSPYSSSPFSPSSSSSSFSSSATATANANALLRAYAACAARAADALDRPAAAPMIVGLRDATYEAGRGRDWPRLSVPAAHAVADRLAPRHAGAWRFLPCDVWGRPRELGFLG
ncbi:hypothetical protein F4809DRAFT_7225 [Biscogniauxia mediterranea]|nr:hypothetical protein F4809DRAFT_7225 [Biscogniauxia mediterranea]